MLLKIDYSNLLNIYIPACALVFYFIEKNFPERPINIKKEFSKDIAAFAALTILGPFFATPLANYYKTFHFNALEFIYQMHPVFRVLLASLITDFLNYWVHYCMHKYSWYWKVHLFHHRVVNLYWFSGLRASVLHYISFIMVRITVGLLLFQLSTSELFYYFAIGFTFNSYQHTNSKTTLKFVEWIFVTPRFHRLHHSSQGRKLKNIGTVFSFWDRMFGTYLDPETAGTGYELGIKAKSDKFSFKEFIGY
ncbi:MAG: sterol desaturase family protein [Bacteriovorax sp.]|jgi:sterol desaturase/sphingolipid hydroxylase (fatty acid hydroxylase superfamily)